MFSPIPVWALRNGVILYIIFDKSRNISVLDSTQSKFKGLHKQVFQNCKFCLIRWFCHEIKLWSFLNEFPFFLFSFLTILSCDSINSGISWKFCCNEYDMLLACLNFLFVEKLFFNSHFCPLKICWKLLSQERSLLWKTFYENLKH